MAAPAPICPTAVRHRPPGRGNGHDVLLGGALNDSLFGQEGDDRLEGGADNDGLSGGPNFDTCLQDGGRGPRTSCEA